MLRRANTATGGAPLSEVEQAVLEGFRGIQVHLDGVEALALEGAVADRDIRFKTWLDMHLLAATARRQTGHMQQMHRGLSDIKTPVAEIYPAMAAAPGIPRLRGDVSSVRNQSVSLELWVAAIEGHPGLDHGSVPR